MTGYAIFNININVKDCISCHNYSPGLITLPDASAALPNALL